MEKFYIVSSFLGITFGNIVLPYFVESKKSVILGVISIFIGYVILPFMCGSILKTYKDFGIILFLLGIILGHIVLPSYIKSKIIVILIFILILMMTGYYYLNINITL